MQAFTRFFLPIFCAWFLGAAALAQPAEADRQIEQLMARAGVHRGLVVWLGRPDAAVCRALGARVGVLAQVLTRDAAHATALRTQLADAGVYGKVSVGTAQGARLPYASGLVNLLISDAEGGIPGSEAMRVLAPRGVLMSRGAAGAWERRVKPPLAGADDWGHYLHDAGNNAVAADRHIGPPRALRWAGSPRWARHHDRLASMSALVSSGGRLFYIFDEGPTDSILLPSTWSLIARDAHNGVVLWKQPIPEWMTHLWPLKSGPAQLPRRLVAEPETVFATLGLDVPVTALNAADGTRLRDYAGTRGTEEILVADGVLYLVVDPQLDIEKYTDPGMVRQPWWTDKSVRVMAVAVDTGEILWTHASPVVTLTLAVGGEVVTFHDGTRVVSLSRRTGEVAWESEPLPIAKRIMSFFAPTLVAHDGVVLFAGGEESGLVKSGGGAVKNDTISALDAKTGRTLWQAEHTPSGYSSPEDVFVIGDAVWYAGVSNGRLPGVVTGRKLRTGELVKQYDAADVETFWFHHRCHRGKASEKYLMVSRTGIEFIDPDTGHWDINHWVRGGCMYGILPANGLVYAPPHDCACYPESKLFGFNALAATVAPLPTVPAAARLVPGPAFGKVDAAAAQPDAADWPTYRRDAWRSGASGVALGNTIEPAWTTPAGTGLSAVTVGGGRLLVADVDTHTVHALDADSGAALWRFTAGGRVDSPPTIHSGTALFGCADGWIYCLRLTDGVPVWRFRAAPADTRIVSFGQLESKWPVHGSVLVQDGVVYAVAGRSLFLDGGLRFIRLDAATGQLLGEEALDDRDPDAGTPIQAHVKRLTMPVALPDVLSSDGKRVYMRSQVFDMDGKRREIAPVDAKLGAHAAVQEGESRHLFSSSGFLDGTWFHRAYWIYGRKFEGGWNSYYLAGKRTAAGKILVADKDRVYGFGRQTKYFKWTTPMEYHLFAEPRGGAPAAAEEKPKGSIVRIEKSASLNPADSAISVSLWARPEGRHGVLLARGGGVIGYSLHLRDGRPRFAICIRGARGTASAPKPISNDWTHIAGVLTADARVQLYVDGRRVATAKAPGLLTGDPADAMQIGGDEGSAVADYGGRNAYAGAVDEVRVYKGALSETAVQRLAGAGDPETDGVKLALYMPFDDGSRDVSGAKNHGAMIGTETVAGKSGRALRFSGRLPDAAPSTARVFAWSEGIPMLVRGMAVADQALVVAGPEDVVVEDEAFKTLDDPETDRKIRLQYRALTGAEGGILRTVSALDGSPLLERRIDTVPVWDGIAVARGRIYMAGKDGTVRCFTTGAAQ